MAEKMRIAPAPTRELRVISRATLRKSPWILRAKASSSRFSAR